MRFYLLLIFSIIVVCPTNAQVVINEASYRNFTQLTDDTGNNPDWIELYNAGYDEVNLWHYHLSDDTGNLSKWTLPGIILPSKQWILVYASGTGSSMNTVNHWETAVREDDYWKWINPDQNTSTEWMNPGFDDGSWNLGQGGFGYGDGDDRTLLPVEKVSVFTRITFHVQDLSKIAAVVLHMDYDDGFVAYLNGIEIAKENISNIGWNSTADYSREALIFQGKRPQNFDLPLNKLRNVLHDGENLLAIQGHNFTAGLIDMSLRAFLSFGLTDSDSQFGPLPDWLMTTPESALHANFKLSNSGETLYLSDHLGVMINQLILPPGLPVNSSVGSVTDGSPVRAVFLTGTPKFSNDSQVGYTGGSEPEPDISHPGGFYPDEISVTLSSSSSSSQIRFTSDGQVPDLTSELFTGKPIPIRSSKVIKARCFSTGSKLPGPVVTSSFFIGQNPTPAGILSITMETGDLYGETGIYDNWWTDWKKQCYIEFFEPNSHNPVFKQYAGIKIDGGAGGSREQPQRSFRIEPGNGSLGDGDVQFPLIPSRPDRHSYETFFIRNGSNQYLYYPCKDAIETRCMGEGTRNTYSGYAPVQVYLNGSYWGYYELREKLDEDYFKQHFGTNKDSLEILSVSYWYGGVLRAVTGTDPVARFNEDYNKYLGLNTFNDSFWDLADHLFDLEYYTDYICAQSFMVHIDWPYNNIRIHRSPQTGKRWRFSLIDLEWSLYPNGWSESSGDHIRYMMDYNPAYPYVHIWQKAIQNRRYRDYFINRFADLLNSYWQYERLAGFAGEIYQMTRPELPATFRRWGKHNIPESAYMTQFDEAQEIMLSELSKRPEKIRKDLIKNFNLPKAVTITLNVEPIEAGTIRISTIKPDVYPWTGTYFDGVPIKIEAIPGPGYSFSNWDANGQITDAAKAVFLDTLEQSTAFTAHFKPETFSEKVIISEINYNSEPSVDAGDWIELWNYEKPLTASLNGWYVTDEDSTHVFRFPENMVLRPDERLVVVRDSEKFKAQHPGIPFIGSMDFGLGGSGDAVKLYNYKRELISTVQYQDSGPWPLGADGQGRTLELRSDSPSEQDPSNWFDGCIGGSPGRAYTPCLEQIVISEINYFSDSGWDHGDWVELRNTGENAEDLSGWVFMDEVDSTGHSFTLPGGTIIAPHHSVVLVQDTGKFLSINAGVRNYTGPFVFGLKDKGEWIRAYDASGKLRLSVRYNDTEPWPVLAGGMGYSLELVDSSGVMNDGANWKTGCFGGSPGRYCSPDCSGSGVADFSQVTDITAFPNPASDRIFIVSSGLMPVRITINDLSGEEVLSSNEFMGMNEFSISHLPAGSYIIVVHRKDGSSEALQMVRQ